MPVETALALALVVAVAEVMARTLHVVARAPEVAVGAAGAAERLPVQSTLPFHLVVAAPSERLALQATLQLFPAETPQ